MDNKLVIGLDVGERRIGVAVAGTAARIASAHSYIDRQKNADVVSSVHKVMNGHEVEAIVVGLPRGLDGQDTEQTQRSRLFAAELAQAFATPVVLQDEAATSVLAEERLRARGKPYQKGDIDAEAAALILQDYLNQRAGSTA